MNRVSHAYLFTGPRGTGKTTIAKLFAASVNCTDEARVFCGECENCKANSDNTHPDVIEIDAASNNGVDEIRSLIEKVKYMPILGKYKVYIIDEVHMLSQGAFNALLKTLEEPPEHVIFILATTEVHKVLPTIISRCQRYDFKYISPQDIEKQCKKVLELEKRHAEDGVTQLVASLSGGGMRNALTVLEQAFIINSDQITVNSLYENYGLVFPKEKIKLFNAIQAKDIETMIPELNRIVSKSVDLSRLLMEFITSIKDSLIYYYTKSSQFINQNEIEFIAYLDETFTIDERNTMIDTLLERYDRLKFSSSQETHLELAFIAIVNSIGHKAAPKEAQNKTNPESSVKNNGFKEISKSDNTSITHEKEPEHDAVLSIDEVEPSIKDEKIEPVIIEEEATHNTSGVESEPIIDRIAKLDLGIDEMVQLMVSADKTMRVNDEPAFQSVMRYASDLKWARVSRLLMNCQLVLSGPSFVLVATQRQAQSREIMEERNVYELIEFTDTLIGKRKQVFAATASEFTHAVEQFKIDTQNKTLPEPLSEEDFLTYEIEREEEPQDETLALVLDLFDGKVNVEE